MTQFPSKSSQTYGYTSDKVYRKPLKRTFRVNEATNNTNYNRANYANGEEANSKTLLKHQLAHSQ